VIKAQPTPTRTDCSAQWQPNARFERRLKLMSKC